MALLLCFLISSCTENSKVRTFGGTATIKLKENSKLINITYKDNNVWYLTRPMLNSDTATTYEFHEKSQFGAMEGTYFIVETKTIADLPVMKINGVVVPYKNVQQMNGTGDNVNGNKTQNVKNLNQ